VLTLLLQHIDVMIIFLSSINLDFLQCIVCYLLKASAPGVEPHSGYRIPGTAMIDPCVSLHVVGILAPVLVLAMTPQKPRMRVVLVSTSPEEGPPPIPLLSV